MIWSLSPGEKLILASSSPRRRELLESCKLVFEVIPPYCKEEGLKGESPEEQVRRLAALKAENVADSNPASWVLGADTVVALDGDIFGKPSDEQEAAMMLERLATKVHQVWGGVALLNHRAGAREVLSFKTDVKIIPLSSKNIKDYIATEEPFDKAGAYAIQGKGMQFVDSINGSYTNVVGLHLTATLELLRRHSVIH